MSSLQLSEFLPLHFRSAIWLSVLAFARLRYSLGGLRPRETTNHTMSQDFWLALNKNAGGISEMSSLILAY